MNERMKEIWGKLSRRLDLVVLGVLLFLLILTGYLFIAESGFGVDEPAPAPPKNFTEKLPLPRVIPPKEGQKPEIAEQFEEVRESLIATDPDISKNEEAYKAIEVNMFDIKTVEEAERKSEELNQQYNQAERLFSQGNHQEALSAVQAILKEDPNHRSARELKARLDALSQPTPAPQTPAAPAP